MGARVGRKRIEIVGRKFEKVLELYSKEKISMTDAASVLGVATGTFKRMVEERIEDGKRGERDEESDEESKE